MELKRVVVTGLGAITPIGNSVPEFWENLVNGDVYKRQLYTGVIMLIKGELSIHYYFQKRILVFLCKDRLKRYNRKVVFEI